MGILPQKRIKREVIMKIHEAFKVRLYELCKLQGISFTELCKDMGVNRNLVFVEGRGININTLVKLCEGLKITTKKFFNSSYFKDINF